jgi:hypothetical protein
MCTLSTFLHYFYPQLPLSTGGEYVVIGLHKTALHGVAKKQGDMKADVCSLIKR